VWCVGAPPADLGSQSSSPLVLSPSHSPPLPPVLCRNGYHCNIDESILRKLAQVLVSTGLRDLGYDYVNIDGEEGDTARAFDPSTSHLLISCVPPHSPLHFSDCWAVDRRPDGTIIEDPTRFPSGIRAVADFTHSLGMKFGIYTAQHQYTCQLRPGR
jgi:alpha-galactosidase